MNRYSKPAWIHSKLTLCWTSGACCNEKTTAAIRRRRCRWNRDAILPEEVFELIATLLQ